MSSQDGPQIRHPLPFISERLEAELSLLQAMYPDSVTFNPRSSELTFHPDNAGSAKLLLRLPDTYPDQGTPEIILATGVDKTDLRQKLTCSYAKLTLDPGGDDGGEILDALLSTFTTSLDPPTPAAKDDNTTTAPHPSKPHLSTGPCPAAPSKTVIIWLHHLLATSKRKLALHPSGAISGVTKPGYPGVMLFTGPKDAIDEHVRELKGLNWQAFSVRYEEEDDEGWVIRRKDGAAGGGGGGGIEEVESMAEMVQMIEEGKREVFLRAVGVK